MNRICLALFFVATAVSLWAQGSPPFFTDDAATVSKKQWELDIGFYTERSRAGGRAWEAPSVDLAYGLTDAIELDYGVPLLIVRPADGSSIRGMGNSVAGVKWRFYEDSARGLCISVDPQVEFNNPGSSRRHGLVGNNTEFILPFQIQKSFGEVSTAFNIGRTFHAREPRETDGWLAGVAVGRRVSERLYAGAELYGEADRRLKYGWMVFNLGACFEVNDWLSFSFSGGRGIAGADRPDYMAFVGVQLVR